MHRRIGSRTSIIAGRVRKRSAMSRKLVAFSSDLPESQSQHGSRHLLDPSTYFARIAQFRVMCLILFARLASSTGAYVSVRTGYVITVTAKELIAVMYSIHRQPRGLCTMKAPTWKWLADENRVRWRLRYGRPQNGSNCKEGRSARRCEPTLLRRPDVCQHAAQDCGRCGSKNTLSLLTVRLRSNRQHVLSFVQFVPGGSGIQVQWLDSGLVLRVAVGLRKSGILDDGFVNTPREISVLHCSRTNEKWTDSPVVLANRSGAMSVT
jgi:hypothetical protein